MPLMRDKQTNTLVTVEERQLALNADRYEHPDSMFNGVTDLFGDITWVPLQTRFH